MMFFGALVLAGWLSIYASTQPDGLDRVATNLNFAAVGQGLRYEMPLVDYQLPVARDHFLSILIPRCLGVVAVSILIITGGEVLRYFVNRRLNNVICPNLTRKN